MAVKHEKRSGAFGGIFLIQIANEFRAKVDEGAIFPRQFARVRQVSEQGKMNVWIVITQEANFQIFGQRVYLGFIQEQGGYGNQGDAVARDSVKEVVLRQDRRGQHRGHKIIHQLDGTLGTRQQQHQKRDQEKNGRE